MMNESQLKAIEERANKASNAPWIVEAGDYSGANWMIGATSVFLGGSAWDDKSYYITTQNVHASELEGDAKTDAEFIAHAREDVPALIAEVRSLRAKLDAVPVMAILQLTKDAIDDAWSRKTLRAVRAWLKTQAVSA